MALTYAFQPAYGTGGSASTGASSAEISIGSGQKSIKITNSDSTNGAFVKVGNSGISATSADLWVAPGETVVLTKEQDHDTLAHLQSVGSVDIYYILGEGKA